MTFPEDIEAAVAIMRQGGVIVYPTDTVWGIGCDARCSDAVRRVFEIKHRSDSKALITLVSDEDMLSECVGEVNDAIREVMNAVERPTTIVYPLARGLAPELLAEDGSVGVRLTREAYSAALCRGLGAPVVSTSANISGEPTPGCFADISEQILDKADYVAQARRDEMACPSPSRVIKVEADGSITVIRP
ncbi:L-threonylcarbamoyladenylate synthase [uncultured Duncaniella sp.]|uniref:L-threonylcarbamoyladenylate synthase n=1 Tax=uncultured Duncaniella sp. TaxID=2768039 RepID=UPI0025ADA035|nr:L-threonylcarbamoyladenylate synthase [uncultured Duncaniella sp.]